MLYEIKSDTLSVSVSNLGAELQSIQLDGAEYLWNGNPKYWPGRAINIFPYVARLTEGRYSYKNNSYDMNIHGFIHTSWLTAETHRKDSISFYLKSDATTRTIYPFDFLYRVSYYLEDARLNVCYEIENHGEEEMYFGLGGHPGFKVPLEDHLDFEDYVLEFPSSCQPNRVTFSPLLLVTGAASYPLENGNTIKLNHHLFDDDAVILQQVPQSVTLKSNKGRRGLTVTYPDMPILGLWHAPKTDAPYICIEPLSSLPSRQGKIEDLQLQLDLIRLDAYKTYINRWWIDFV